jgi:hypothetical protein
LTKSFDKSADAADRPGAGRRANQPNDVTCQSLEAVMSGEGIRPDDVAAPTLAKVLTANEARSRSIARLPKLAENA